MGAPGVLSPRRSVGNAPLFACRSRHTESRQVEGTVRSRDPWVRSGPAYLASRCIAAIAPLSAAPGAVSSGISLADVAGGKGWSYFFIDVRRRWISDRIWYGLALTVVGFGNLMADVIPAWLGLMVGVAGLGLIAWSLATRR